MKFGLVIPQRGYAMLVDVPFLDDAMHEIGLNRGKVDFGTVTRGVSVVVDENGLFVPPDEQAYFCVHGYRHLLAGPAVLYGFDEAGETVDLRVMPRIVFLPDKYEVLNAIASGLIDRPVIGAGDDVIWTWPGPKPSKDQYDRLFNKNKGARTIVIDDDTIITVEEPKK